MSRVLYHAAMSRRPDATPLRGVEGLDADFVAYRRLLGDRNEVYALLLTELEALLAGPSADSAIIEPLARTWRAREFAAYYERPLLLQAALRFDALSSPSHPLADALRSERPDPRAITRSAVRASLEPDRMMLWLALASRRVQTNDVSRSVAWLWPTSLLPARPIVLVDVGCSAGLNLVGDQLELEWTRGDGVPLGIRAPEVLARVGFDRSPIDVRQDDDAAWLRACVWPGDSERLRRLDQAIEAARRQTPPLEVARVSARHVVARLRRLARETDPGATLVVLQSFVRDYMEADERDDYARQLTEWMSRQPVGRALICELELPADGLSPPAQLVAWPSGHARISLARCSYHPSQLEIDPAGVRALRRVYERESAPG